DGHRCRMHGWIAVSWDEADLRFEHLRPMGTSHKSWWTGRARHGSGQYFMGTGLAFMTVSALYRMTRPPYVVGGLAMLWGSVWSLPPGRPGYAAPDFRHSLRRYQSRCLLVGKARATGELERERADRWNPARHPLASVIPYGQGGLDRAQVR